MTFSGTVLALMCIATSITGDWPEKSLAYGSWDRLMDEHLLCGCIERVVSSKCDCLVWPVDSFHAAEITGKITLDKVEFLRISKDKKNDEVMMAIHNLGRTSTILQFDPNEISPLLLVLL